MELIGVASTTLLALVLLVAGAAKARDRAGTARAAEGLGLPGALAGVASVVVPALELTLGVAVWVPAVHTAAAWAAAALLGAFTVVVGVALLRGRRVACACFGAFDDAEIGGGTLLRNGALIAVAALAATTTPWPTGEPGRTVAPLVVAVVLMAAVLAYLVGMLLELSREYASLLSRVESGAAGSSGSRRTSSRIEPDLVPAGSPLALELTTTADEPISAETLFAAPATLLVLADPGCRACTAMLPQLALWAEAHPEVPVVVSARLPMRKAELLLPAASSTVVVDRGHTAHRGLGRPGLPAAVLMADDGRTASPVAAGADAVLALLESLGSRPALGELTVHDGVARSPLGVAVGADADLLFVMPGCSHCERLAEALEREAVDLSGPGRRRRVVVVSSGTPEATRALGIEGATSVYDLDGSLLVASGAPGTPALVTMVDGRVTGSVVAGAPAVAEALALRDRDVEGGALRGSGERGAG